MDYIINILYISFIFLILAPDLLEFLLQPTLSRAVKLTTRFSSFFPSLFNSLQFKCDVVTHLTYSYLIFILAVNGGMD